MLTTSHTVHCHEVNELISPQVELLQIAKYFEICIKEKGKRSRKRKNQCKGKKKKKNNKSSNNMSRIFQRKQKVRFQLHISY